MKPQRVTIQIKATEQYFHVVLFIMLYKLVLTFKFENETLECDHGFHVERVKSDETRVRSHHTKVEELLVVHKSYRGIEWCLRAFASMRAVRIFLRAQAVINFSCEQRSL